MCSRCRVHLGAANQVVQRSRRRLAEGRTQAAAEQVGGDLERGGYSPRPRCRRRVADLVRPSDGDGRDQGAYPRRRTRIERRDVDPVRHLHRPARGPHGRRQVCRAVVIGVGVLHVDLVQQCARAIDLSQRPRRLGEPHADGRRIGPGRLGAPVQALRAVGVAGERGIRLAQQGGGDVRVPAPGQLGEQRLVGKVEAARVDARLHETVHRHRGPRRRAHHRHRVAVPLEERLGMPGEDEFFVVGAEARNHAGRGDAHCLDGLPQRRVHGPQPVRDDILQRLADPAMVGLRPAGQLAVHRERLHEEPGDAAGEFDEGVHAARGQRATRLLGAGVQLGRGHMPQHDGGLRELQRAHDVIEQLRSGPRPAHEHRRGIRVRDPLPQGLETLRVEQLRVIHQEHGCGGHRHDLGAAARQRDGGAFALKRPMQVAQQRGLARARWPDDDPAREAVVGGGHGVHAGAGEAHPVDG